MLKKKLSQKLAPIPEGTKVKLNYESIISDVNYNKNIDSNKQKYHEFIELNKDRIFSVEYDPKFQDNPTLVCLKEDETDPKWLFWIGDLIVINEKGEKAN